MPVATETPVRSVSPSMSMPESSSAIRAAATIIWAKRSIRRDCADSGHDHPSSSVHAQVRVPLHAQAAVDEEYLACDERGLVRTEKTYRNGDVFRIAQTPERRVAEDEPALLLVEDVGQLGGDVTGRDRVHANAARPQLAGQRLRQT